MGASASAPRTTDPQALAEQEFDYIIVGSGMLTPYSELSKEIEPYRRPQALQDAYWVNSLTSTAMSSPLI